MFLSNSFKFIFISIPKTGTESILCCLKSIGPFKKEWLEKKIDFKKDNICPDEQRHVVIKKHIKAAKLKNILGNEEWKYFFKFAFVRNPWDWMVSFYHYSKNFKIPENVTMPASNEDPFYNLAARIKKMSFYDFVIDRTFDSGWHNVYSNFILDENGKNLLDFIGRFENLQNDFDKACFKIGIEKMRLPHIHSTAHSHYSTYYKNEKTKQIVAKMFQKDISTFGYRFEKSE